MNLELIDFHTHLHSFHEKEEIKLLNVIAD